MGQHKHNLTAIKAKNGELSPKPKKLGKRESERLLYKKCQEIIYNRCMTMYEKMQEKEHKEWK